MSPCWWISHDGSSRKIAGKCCQRCQLDDMVHEWAISYVIFIDWESRRLISCGGRIWYQLTTGGINRMRKINENFYQVLCCLIQLNFNFSCDNKWIHNPALNVCKQDMFQTKIFLFALFQNDSMDMSPRGAPSPCCSSQSPCTTPSPCPSRGRSSQRGSPRLRRPGGRGGHSAFNAWPNPPAMPSFPFMPVSTTSSRGAKSQHFMSFFS